MEDRKKDHLEFALESQIAGEKRDTRFSYEPLLSGHPQEEGIKRTYDFFGKGLSAPIWISSMTGGTSEAQKINENLAKACAHFKLGMGVGSCRMLLEEGGKKYFEQFNLRPFLGDDRPFYANLGIAQIEKYLKEKKIEKIIEMVETLKACGLIIHVNPMQEWLQPEGDKILTPPIETLQRFLEDFPFRVIVKEVGQGMGARSLRALLQLPLAGIDFAALGGTNFSQVEIKRHKNHSAYEALSYVGHSLDEMVMTVKNLIKELGGEILCQDFILSGGVKSFLDGYYYLAKFSRPALYGMGSTLLPYARKSYEDLHDFLQKEIAGLHFAQTFLRVN